MVTWFRRRPSGPEKSDRRKVTVPEGLWIKCNNCSEIIYSKEIDRNLKVCPKCEYHFRITARDRIDLMAGSAMGINIVPAHIGSSLGFQGHRTTGCS